MFKRQGWRRALMGGVVGVGSVIGLLSTAAAPAQAAGPGLPKPVTSYSFTSAAGDYVGGGAASSYTPADSAISIAGTADSLQVSVSRADENWTVWLAAPRGDVLRPGVYTKAEEAPIRTGHAPGLFVFGDGRACSNLYGQFSIDQIATDPATGDVTMLDASYTQRCTPTGPALKGTVKYQAYPWSFAYSGDAEDYIGQGQSAGYRGANSTFGLTGKADGVLTYSVSGKRDDWTALIAPPAGETLTAGKTYSTSELSGAGIARLDFFGDGRGCDANGELTVTKLAVDPDGAVTALAATFVQHCGSSEAALRGTIHYLA
ncbi:hypothetical protein [Streptomyces sp. NPDC049040]|uniref:hypothetical protein n=1 Tax=Streptomyces sp. NPDC049040 TaxID=3365593 RepID=UPI00372454A9